MAFEVSVGDASNVLGGLAVIGFGVFAATTGARDRAMRGFLAFTVGFGGAVALRNLADMGVSSPSIAAPLYLLAGVGWIVAALGVIAFGLSFPTPLARSERRLLALPAAALATAGVLAWFTGQASLAAWRAGDIVQASLLSYFVGSSPGFGAMFALLMLLPLRVPSADAAGRSQLALVSAALIPYVAYSAAMLLATPGNLIGGVGLLAMTLVVSGLWLRAASKGLMSRTARNLALLGPILLLYGAIEAVFFGTTIDPGSVAGTSGVLRLVTVAILTYAVVRHRMLGIDVKVRWTLSKSTIAAAFIAVFFITSEAAQQFFGETLGSTYVGIGAAGMLVFVMAPLQRAAERLAEKAVPTSAPSAPVMDAHEDAYKAAVRLALRGGITRKEELELARIADAHGISAVRAHALRDDVENGRTQDPGAPG